MPSRAATGRAFTHGLKLGRNLLQGTGGCGSLDARDEADQAVIAALRSGTAQQCRLNDALGGKTFDGPAQTLDGPYRGPALIKDTNDVSPGLIGAHSADGRQPGVQMSQETVEVSRGAAGAQFANSGRVASAEPRVTADPSPCLGGTQAGFGTLCNQRSLELGNGAEHLEGEHALRGSGVDRVMQAAEMSTGGLELFDDGE